MKRANTVWSIFGFISVACCLLSIGNVSAAAAPQTLSIGPSVVSQVIDPGATVNGKVLATNLSQGVDTYSAYTKPYSVVNQNYDPSFIPNPARTDVSSWFHVFPTKGLLSPNQNVTVSYTITVPSDATPGGYYAALFVQATPLQTSLTKAKQVNISERVGTLFYIEVTGPLNQQGGLTSWHTNFLQKPNINSVIKLNNTGDIYYISTIHVTYRDILGGPKYSYSTQKIVLQNTIRKITITWLHSPSFGLFKVNGTASAYGTIQLGTEYVLVMSNTVRIIVGIVVFMLVVIIIRRLLKNPYLPYKIRRK